MSRKSQEIPPIQLDAELDRDTARQIVEGARDFASELRVAHERGLAHWKSEAFKKLRALVDHVLTLDLALPSAVKLGLLSIRGSHWKKPWEDLKKSISQWQTPPEGHYERIIPAFGDMDEPSGFLDTEADRKQRQAQARTERRALANIASDLDRVLNMLTQLSQASLHAFHSSLGISKSITLCTVIRIQPIAQQTVQAVETVRHCWKTSSQMAECSSSESIHG